MSASGRPGAAVLAVIAVAALAAVATALVSQHVFGMEPCPWCALQRLVLIAIALVAIVGSMARGHGGRRVSAALILALAASGVAAALWQHFRAAASASCNLTLADRILGGLKLTTAVPELFEPRASCADAAVKLLGVSYDFWSLALFALISAASLRLLTKPARGRR